MRLCNQQLVILPLLLSFFLSALIPASALWLELPGPTCSMLSKLERQSTLDVATLEQSIVNSGGSSHSFNAFLHKWVHHPAEGRALNVVVQGGSFSTGAGLLPQSLYAQQLVDQLNAMNPAVNVVLTNNAVGECSSMLLLLW